VNADCLYAARAELAEGPVWHDGALWWVDIVAGTLNRLDPRTGLNTARATGDFLGAAVPDNRGGWILAQRKRLARLDWTRGEITEWSIPAVPPGPRHRFNDAKCGPDGRLWVGTLSLEGERDACALYRFSGRQPGRLVVPGVSLSNGLAWSPDGSRLYHADTLAGCIQSWVYDVESGSLLERSVLAQIHPRDGYPDGMCADAEGHLWVALWGGGCVVRVDGRSGRILDRYQVPVSQPSSCAFGGEHRDTLFITSAWQGMTATEREAEPLAGSLFVMNPDARGLPNQPFQLEGNEP
jgi:sugar lactone lactonase YvrE